MNGLKLTIATFVFAFFAFPAGATLTAGVGQANINPAPSLFPIDNGFGDAPFNAVHDPLFARALVLDQNGVQTVMIVTDTIIVPDEIYERLVARIAVKYRIAKNRIWLTATHVHTVPWSFANGYEQTVAKGVLGAVSDAMDSLEPVTVGWGTGIALLNVNRDERTPNGFILGQDPAGPSDKTVRVFAFFRADGRPKAILVNYAVHAVVLHSSVTGEGRNSLISADLPGVTNAFVDDHFRGAMTFWTSGAAADQNPLMMSYYAEPGAEGTTVATDLKASGFSLVSRWGQNLGLEVIRVVDAMKPVAVTGSIRAADTIVQCPPKSNINTLKPLRVSWLGIGPIDLVAISGELNTLIDRRVRELSNPRSPILLALTNGYSGYLPDDASYARGATFEVEHSSFAAGCLEKAIVRSISELLGSR